MMRCVEPGKTTMMLGREMAGANCRGRATLLCVAAFFAGTAYATPIPPASFTYDVIQGATILAGCTPLAGTSIGGTCGSEASGPGYAATSGGIGSASYLPVTPGGTVLGPGTAVDAMSTWTSGGRNESIAAISYSFEATGPSNVEFIPIDVLSKGLIDATGDATAFLSLVITDSGPDSNIPKGIPDPDPSGPLLDLTAFCTDGSCRIDSWNTPGNELTDLLCVVNGDNYVINIEAVTSAGSGRGVNDASAVLDPEIKIDPPYPMSCPVPAPLSALGLDTGPGASTGFPVPEPSGYDLAAIGLLALGGLGVVRSRSRAKVKAEGRSS
jgi:hypothetical protein